MQQWERLADQADALVKQRDPDGAIEVFDAALQAAENSPVPAPPNDIARICYRMGSIEAGIGSTASARGSLEYGKRILLDQRKAGKLDAVGIELLGNIEATLRRLPRQ